MQQNPLILITSLYKHRHPITNKTPVYIVRL